MFKRKNQKSRKKIKRLIWIVFILGIICTAAFLGLMKRNKINLPNIFNNQTEIVSPLANPTKIDKLKDKLKEKGIEIDWRSEKENKIENKKWEMRLKNGESVIFSLEKDIDEQINSLQMILKRFKIEGRQFEKIDLRFEKPVITYGSL